MPGPTPRIWRPKDLIEIGNHCTSRILVELIRGVKQRYRPKFAEKLLIDPAKMAVLTSIKLRDFRIDRKPGDSSDIHF